MTRNVVRVLLVDDDPGDIELTKASLEACKLVLDIAVVSDGEKAMEYLRRQGEYANIVLPDVVLLDLNMPRMDGREVLKAMKDDPVLRTIPVVILTTSDADKDVVAAYASGANCYVSKPMGLQQFSKVVNAVGDFWFTIVRLPPPPSGKGIRPASSNFSSS